jgi:hypothetical protein
LSTFDESPLKQLGVSHISEHPSVGEGFEVLETVAEGYLAGQFGFWIAPSHPPSLAMIHAAQASVSGG